MDLKFISKLFLINLTIASTLCSTFEDVCHPEDKECFRPSIPGLGNLLWGRCCSLGVLRRIGSISLLECAKECLLTTGCFSLNYRQNWHLCELLERHKNGESNCNVFLHGEGCIHSNISTWSKKLSGKCIDHHCADGQRCYFDVGTGVECKVACKYYCSGEHPNVLYASPDEYFGPSRDVRHGVKFKCDHNFRLVGKPYVACSDRGGGRAEWDILFTCYQETQGAYLTNIDFVFIQGSHNQKDRSSLNWKYEDGTQMDYFNWGAYQPDGNSPTGTDYIALYNPEEFKWHDVSTIQPYTGIPICEIDLTT
ncbi:unnamed protein product [Mytilus edulis]|uniref:C-type lectin domain-containing protein n=1 Tax=Mytilus edulis TaxID=6550 RepID=A0A8S3RQ16_MYTED|nr:unnamed protein product [Mytilus edulis]